MASYSDFLLATNVRAGSSREEIERGIQQVLQQPSFSLLAKGLYTLLVEQPGEAVNPFHDLYEPAEAVHRAAEELISAGLAIRV